MCLELGSLVILNVSISIRDHESTKFISVINKFLFYVTLLLKCALFVFIYIEQLC